MKNQAQHYFSSKLVVLVFISQCTLLGLIQLVFSLNSSLGIILAPFIFTLCFTPLLHMWIINPIKKENSKLQDKLNHLALHDNLTRLSNRRFLIHELIKLQSTLARHYHYAAIIYIDLDHFKTINSQYGHETGDRVLIEIGQRLIAAFRLEDIVSRISDDEFVVLLTHIGDDAEQAEKRSVIAAERMLEEIERPYNIELDTIKIKAKIGIEIISPEKRDPELILEIAHQKINKNNLESIN